MKDDSDIFNGELVSIPKRRLRDFAGTLSSEKITGINAVIKSRLRWEDQKRESDHFQEDTIPSCFHGWRASDPLIFIPPLFRFFLNENEVLIDYIPIFLLLAVAATLGIVLANINRFLGPRLPSEEKLSTYESGMEPIRTARDRFTVRFYLVAILFILFDVEIVFMYPWAVNFLSLGWFGFIEMVVFVVVLLIGYYYVIKKGALQWQ